MCLPGRGAGEPGSPTILWLSNNRARLFSVTVRGANVAGVLGRRG
jgi:hypothetical protein